MKGCARGAGRIHGAPRVTENASAGRRQRFRAARRTTERPSGTRRPVEEEPCAVHGVHGSRSARPGQAEVRFPDALLTCAYVSLTAAAPGRGAGSAKAWHTGDQQVDELAPSSRCPASTSAGSPTPPSSPPCVVCAIGDLRGSSTTGQRPPKPCGAGVPAPHGGRTDVVGEAWSAVRRCVPSTRTSPPLRSRTAVRSRAATGTRGLLGGRQGNLVALRARKTLLSEEFADLIRPGLLRRQGFVRAT